MRGQIYLVSGSGFPYASVLYRLDNDGLHRDTEIVRWGIGSVWTALSLDERKAIFWESPREVADVKGAGIDHAPRVLILDLDSAKIVKSCIPPDIPGMNYLEQWLADEPGRGLALQFALFPGSSLKPGAIQEMALDPKSTCEQSFRVVPTSAVRYLVANGTGGFADSEGTLPGAEPWVQINSDGEIFLSLGIERFTADLGYRMPKDLLTFLAAGQQSPPQIVVNNSRVMIVSLFSSAQVRRFFALRKSDRTWHRLPVREDSFPFFREFNGFVAVTEAPMKKAISEQMAKHRGFVENNQDTAQRETSAGSAEWRKDESPTGPSKVEYFGDSLSVYTGRLYLYDISKERFFAIATNQGDSEIVLVENGVVYYRVSDRLYSAPITNSGVGTGKLLAADEVIRDAHWAFIRH